MPARRIHLVSNAHLDPVWLWEWQEGAGEALSTFRQAAEFCETRKGYIFCHNEAVLYRWVEEYEPALFRRIRKLVREKKWHIMGGWYVQPDCNMPSGESFVRQILLGRRYFAEKFGVEPRTAVNLDPFGHTRGLVQILAKSGYDAYLFCRPGNRECPLPRDEFVWVGYDGSEVLANRASAHYCSVGGQERARLEKWLADNPEGDLVIHLWGIGNHGGGPSRKDLADLEALAKERPDLELVHSTPDAYFRELEKRRAGAAAPREGPQPLGRRLLHLDVPGQAGPPAARERALLGREDGHDGLAPRPHALSAGGARRGHARPGLRRIPRHPPRLGHPGRRGGRRPDDRPRPRDAVPAQGPGLFRPGRRRAQGRGGRDPHLRLQSSRPRRPGPGRVRVRALGAELREDRVGPEDLGARQSPPVADRKGGEQPQPRVAQARRLRGRARPGPAEQVLLPARKGA